MDFRRVVHTVLLVAIVASAGALLGPSPAHAQQGTQTVTRNYTLKPGTREHQAVQAWLRQHATRIDGAVVGEFDRLGVVHVKHTSKTPLVTAAVPGPPVPLPIGGREGDTITIAACTGGMFQRWSYEYRGGEWRLRSYSVDYMTSCPPAGGD